MLSRDARHLIESAAVILTVPTLMLGVAVAGVPDLSDASDPALATLANVSEPAPNADEKRSPAPESTAAPAAAPAVGEPSEVRNSGAGATAASPVRDSDVGAGSAAESSGQAPASPSEPSVPPAAVPEPPAATADETSTEAEEEPSAPAPEPPVSEDTEATGPATDDPIEGAIETVQPAVDAVEGALDETDQLLNPILVPNP